jgi:hypothetical protein
MKRILFVLALGALLAFDGFSQAQAQEARYGNRPWELNLHAGVTEKGRGGSVVVLFGARVVRNAPSGWGFGVNFDNVVEDFDVNRLLYSGEVDYTFRSSNRARFFVGAGIGATTRRIPDAPGRLPGHTDLLVPLAVGVKWLHRTDDPSWAIRADVRDNIYFGEGFDPDTGNSIGTEAQHNIELSGGVSFLFGGGTANATE